MTLKTSNIVVIQCRGPTVANNERMKDANAAINNLKKNLALNGIRTHELCVTGAMLYQLGYQSHTRAIVFGFGPTAPLSYGFDSSVGRALHR